MDPELPIPQDEARRRLIAGVALRPDIARVEALGPPRSGFSASHWKRVGTTRDFKPRHADAAARALGLPYEWFTVPDLAEAVRLGAERHAAATASDPNHGDPLADVWEDPDDDTTGEKWRRDR